MNEDIKKVEQVEPKKEAAPTEEKAPPLNNYTGDEEKKQEQEVPQTSNKSLQLIKANEYNIYNSKVNAQEVELAGPLVKRAINIFVAESGSGKSITAFCIAWRELKEQNFNRVVYFDLDNQPDEFKHRYERFELLQNFDYITEKDLLDYFTESEIESLTPREKALYLLNHLGDNFEIDGTLVVVDSLQFFVDYNDKRQITPFFDMLRRIVQRGGTALVLHHKSVKSEAEAFKGLSDIRDGADLMVAVIPDRGRGNLIKSVKLKRIKNRTLASFDEFVVAFDTIKGEVSYDKNVLLDDEIPTKNKIVEVLEQRGRMKQSEIIEAVRPQVELGINRIGAVLEKMVGLHIVEVTRGDHNAKLFSLVPQKQEAYEESKEEVPFS